MIGIQIWDRKRQPLHSSFQESLSFYRCRWRSKTRQVVQRSLPRQSRPPFSRRRETVYGSHAGAPRRQGAGALRVAGAQRLCGAFEGRVLLQHELCFSNLFVQPAPVRARTCRKPGMNCFNRAGRARFSSTNPPWRKSVADRRMGKTESDGIFHPPEPATAAHSRGPRYNHADDDGGEAPLAVTTYGYTGKFEGAERAHRLGGAGPDPGAHVSTDYGARTPPSLFRRIVLRLPVIRAGPAVELPRRAGCGASKGGTDLSCAWTEAIEANSGYVPCSAE